MPKKPREPVDPGFANILHEDRHHMPRAYEATMKQMFHGIDIQGKSVLDVGSGRGLTSLWLALQGASRVVSMEPEKEGSRSGAVRLQRERIEKLGLDQIELVTCEFQHYQADEPFDVVVSNASINHLNESQQHALRSRETFDAFLTIATQLKRSLRPGGVAVVTDASRYGFFTLARAAGLPKRCCYHCKTIDFKLHQTPAVWQRIFRQAGFERIEIDYPVPHPLRRVEPLINNAVANFFLQGSFILRAWK